MFFKKLLLVAAALTITACAKIKQSPGSPIVIATSSDSGCFSDLGNRIKTYMDGTMSESEVHAFWLCASHNLAQYRSYTRGDAAGGAYSAQALSLFIETYFMPGEHLSPASLKGFMGLKRIVLGGDETLVTADQFDNLQNLFTYWETLSQELRPHMGVLTQHRQATEAEIEAATLATSDVLRKFALNFSRQNQSYAFSDLEAFLNAFRSDTDDQSGSFAKLERLLKLIPPLKTLLISGPSDHLEGNEWAPLFSGCALALKTWTYLAQALLSGNVETILSGTLMPQTGIELANLADFAIARRSSGSVSIDEFQTVLDVVVQNPSWPESIHSDAIIRVGEWGVRRLLGGDGSNQVSPAVIAAWRTRMKEWKSLALGQTANAAFDALWSEAPLPQWDELGRMVFSPPLPGPDQSRPHRVWSFLAMRWLFESYKADSVATQTQVDQAVSEILPLLQNLGWLKATTPAIGKKLVREADLFTAAGNGDTKLQLGEATRFLNMIVSSFRASQVWIYDSPACAPATGGCLEQTALVQAREILSPMADWPDELLLAENFNPYLERAEQIALSKDVRAEVLTAGDLLQVWQMMSYIEVLFLRFDKDFSQGISVTEAIPALKILGPTAFDILFGWKSAESFTHSSAQTATPQSMPIRSRFSLEASRQNLMHLLETFADL